MVSRRAAWILVCGCLAAQRPVAEPLCDPYTRGEPERMAAVGIEAWAPLPWADEHGTADIDVELGDDPKIRWAETRHFKIGVGLRERPLPEDRTERRELLAEIDALRRQLPGMKRPRALDSWLLLLLWARRLEALYAEFCAQSGCHDEAPPCNGQGLSGLGWRERGELGTGPYLGQFGKFCVLVLERRSDVSRYLRRWAGRQDDEGTCHHFVGSTSQLFITTPDLRTGALSSERGLYCNIVFGCVRNFVTGLMGYRYDVPVWNVEGLANWHRRRIDPSYNSLSKLPESQWSLIRDADWEGKTLARVETGVYDKAAELLQWRQQDLDSFNQHVMMWSRVDFLLAQGRDKYARYLRQLKSLPGFGQTREQVLDHQQQALTGVYGFADAAAFDAAWTAWVEANYRPRRR